MLKRVIGILILVVVILILIFAVREYKERRMDAENQTQETNERIIEPIVESEVDGGTTANQPNDSITNPSSEDQILEMMGIDTLEVSLE